MTNKMEINDFVPRYRLKQRFCKLVNLWRIHFTDEEMIKMIEEGY